MLQGVTQGLLGPQPGAGDGAVKDKGLGVASGSKW